MKDASSGFGVDGAGGLRNGHEISSSVIFPETFFSLVYPSVWGLLLGRRVDLLPRDELPGKKSCSALLLSLWLTSSIRWFCDINVCVGSLCPWSLVISSIYGSCWIGASTIMRLRRL